MSDCERPGEKQRGETGNERQEDEEEGKKGERENNLFQARLGQSKQKGTIEIVNYKSADKQRSSVILERK